MILEAVVGVAREAPVALLGCLFNGLVLRERVNFTFQGVSRTMTYVVDCGCGAGAG